MTKIEDMLAELRQGLPPAPDANLEFAATRTPEAPRCARCGLLPEENAPYLAEVAEFEDVDLAKMSPGEVRELARSSARADGTYNPVGSFYCTACYVELGTPDGKAP